MAQSRLDLHDLLLEITDNVYFQPPNNLHMSFPCIVYNLDGGFTERGDNRLYRYTKRYQVTVIDRNPDSELPDRVIELPMCEFNRFFARDNLNHTVFNLYF